MKSAGVYFYVIFLPSVFRICIKVIVNNVHLTSVFCGTNAY